MADKKYFSEWEAIPDYDMAEPFYKEGVKWLSRHNFELEKKHIDKVIIHDVTLRDGDQTPGTAFLEDERVRVADALAKLKVDRIEAGMPVVSKSVENAIRRMAAKNYPHTKLYGFSRAVKKDIDLCKDVGCKGITIEYCVNPIIIKHCYQKSPQWVAENLIDGINYAKSIGFEDVAFMGWDWFRAPIAFTRALVQELCDKSQLDGLVIVDTYGSTTPDAVEEMFSLFHNWFPRLRLEFHGHRDNGCGVANCLAAMWGGASVIHTAVNGMGERCGNVPLEEVATTFVLHKGVRSQMDLTELAPLCSVVTAISHLPVAPNKPVMGDQWLEIESGIGLDIQYKMAHNPQNKVTNIYEPYNPALVGRMEQVHPVLGKNSGKSSIKLILEKYNLTAADEEMDKVVEMVKAESYVTKSSVGEAMLLKFLHDVQGR